MGTIKDAAVVTVKYWGSKVGKIPAFSLATQQGTTRAITTNTFAVTLSNQRSHLFNIFCETHNLACYSGLSSILFMTLFHYSLETDNLCVAIPFFKKTNHLNQLISKKTNSLMPLCVNLESDITCLNLFKRTQRLMLNAYRHQSIDYKKMQSLWHKKNLPNLNILSCYYAVDKLPNIENLPTYPNTNKHELACFFYHSNQGIKIVVKYNYQLFKKNYIQNFLNTFVLILNQAIDSCNLNVADLKLITQKKIEYIDKQWNNTRNKSWKNETIVSLFEKQVKKTPSNIAVQFNQRRLTYKQLNALANYIAHTQIKASKNKTIGLYLDRGIEMFTAILGVLKTGLAYIAIDPSYPSKHNQYIINNSEVHIILTTSQYVDTLKKRYRRKTIIALDRLKYHSKRSLPNPKMKVSSEQACYIIYTSGSTGKPKGVIISHNNIVNYCIWIYQQFKIKNRIDSIMHSTLSFDGPMTSYLPPILFGSTVTVAPLLPGMEGLSRTLTSKDNVTFLKLTPAHLKYLNETNALFKIKKTIGYLIIGGEEVYKEVVRGWVKHQPNSKIVVHYGPCETTVGCTTFPINNLDDLSNNALPIGRPVRNTTVTVLNKQLNPVPVGVCGELYVSGDCVGLGYLKKSKLTRRCFIKLFKNKNVISYKTGDIVKWDPKGFLVYIGRNDQQIKINGFRVEKQYITNLIKKFVEASRVELIEMSNSLENYIIAFIETKKETITEKQLRAELKRILPKYMMPKMLIFVSKIPLLISGKCDKQALTKSIQRTINTNQSLTAVENELLVLLSVIIPNSRIGKNDSFIEYGLTSLDIVLFKKNIDQHFNLDIEVTAIYENSTIKELAVLVEQNDPVRPPIVKLTGQAKQNLFLAHPTTGVIAEYIRLSKEIYKYFNCHAFQIPCKPTDSNYFSSFQEMCDTYYQAMIKTQPKGPYFLAGHSGGAAITFELASRLKKAGKKIAVVGLIDPPFFRKRKLKAQRKRHNFKFYVYKFIRIFESCFNVNSDISILDFSQLSNRQTINYVFQNFSILQDVFPNKQAFTEQCINFMKIKELCREFSPNFKLNNGVVFLSSDLDKFDDQWKDYFKMKPKMIYTHSPHFAMLAEQYIEPITTYFLALGKNNKK